MGVLGALEAESMVQASQRRKCRARCQGEPGMLADESWTIKTAMMRARTGVSVDGVLALPAGMKGPERPFSREPEGTVWHSLPFRLLAQPGHTSSVIFLVVVVRRSRPLRLLRLAAGPASDTPGPWAPRLGLGNSRPCLSCSGSSATGSGTGSGVR